MTEISCHFLATTDLPKVTATVLPPLSAFRCVRTRKDSDKNEITPSSPHLRLLSYLRSHPLLFLRHCARYPPRSEKKIA